MLNFRLQKRNLTVRIIGQGRVCKPPPPIGDRRGSLWLTLECVEVSVNYPFKRPAEPVIRVDITVRRPFITGYG